MNSKHCMSCELYNLHSIILVMNFLLAKLLCRELEWHHGRITGGGILLSSECDSIFYLDRTTC